MKRKLKWISLNYVLPSYRILDILKIGVGTHNWMYVRKKDFHVSCTWYKSLHEINHQLASPTNIYFQTSFLFENNLRIYFWMKYLSTNMYFYNSFQSYQMISDFGTHMYEKLGSSKCDAYLIFSALIFPLTNLIFMLKMA